MTITFSPAPKPAPREKKAPKPIPPITSPAITVDGKASVPRDFLNENVGLVV